MGKTDLKFYKKIAKKQFVGKIPPKFNQVESRGIYLYFVSPNNFVTTYPYWD